MLKSYYFVRFSTCNGITLNLKIAVLPNLNIIPLCFYTVYYLHGAWGSVVVKALRY
jgi:hypothetical protein